MTRWSVVVPVKRLERAKTRLRASLSATHPDTAAGHTGLVLAMALDTVAAAAACPSVSQVLVVTDDDTVRVALAEVGAAWVPDAPDAGLNPALRHGATEALRRVPGCGVAVLGSDLPALRPGELDGALTAASALGRGFVADSGGTGTTLLAAAPGRALDPAYGPGSAAAHAAGGAHRLTGRWPSLRRDVDTAGDLAEALRIGAGPRTRAAARAVLGEPGPVLADRAP